MVRLDTTYSMGSKRERKKEVHAFRPGKLSTLEAQSFLCLRSRSLPRPEKKKKSLVFVSAGPSACCWSQVWLVLTADISNRISLSISVCLAESCRFYQTWCSNPVRSQVVGKHMFSSWTCWQSKLLPVEPENNLSSRHRCLCMQALMDGD